MTDRLLRLETELFELARSFAEQVLREAFRAGVGELSDLTRDAARAPGAVVSIRLQPLPARVLTRAVPSGAVPSRTVQPPPARPLVFRRTETPALDAKEPEAKPVESKRPEPKRAAEPPKRRGRPPGKRNAPRFDPAPTDDVDTTDTFITDPSLLLGAIGSESTPASRSHRVVREPAPGLLSPSTTPMSRVRASDEQGPVLRPGERVQRTASGGVVLLRRGRK